MKSLRLTRLALSVAITLVVLAVLGWIISGSPLARAATLGGGPHIYPGIAPCDTTLQACIDSAENGEDIQILPGTYFTSVTLNKAVSLIGSDPVIPTVLMALSGDRVLTVTGAAISNSVVISGLQISGGDAVNGGGILITGGAWPQLNNVTILGNRAMMGGGIYLDTGGVTLLNGRIANNTATQSGGGVYVASAGTQFNLADGGIEFNNAIDGAGVFVQDGNAMLTGGLIMSNTAANWGGGLAVAHGVATATQNGASILSNQAGVNGGGVFIDSGQFTLINGIIAGNTVLTNSPSGGGGVMLLQPSAGFKQLGGQVAGNTAPNGGGLYVAAGQVDLSSGQILGNLADSGGGLYVVAGTVSLTDSMAILNNTATKSGGGAYLVEVGALLKQGGGMLGFNHADQDAGGVGIAAGTFSLSDGQVVSNTALGVGGGVKVEGSAATFTQLGGLIIYNSAASGGGVYVYGNADISGGQIISNTATDGGGLYVGAGTVMLEGSAAINNNTATNYGGGLYAATTITVNAVKFIANSAGYDGGAIFFAGNGDARIVNSVFARNSALGSGAGLRLISTGNSVLLHLTIADVVTNMGQAVSVGSGTVGITNTIIASYTYGIDSPSEGTVYEDYNLYFNTEVITSGLITSGGHDVLNQNPIFADPTPGIDDYHLEIFSPAVDAGVDAGVYVDLGGWPRPMGDGFDIGAFEWQADTARIGPGVGDTLNYTSSTGTTTTVTLPPGLVLTPTLIVFENQLNNSTAPTLPVGLQFAGTFFEINAFLNSLQLQGLTFTLPVTIVIHYSAADVAGLLPGSIKLYRYEYPPYGSGWCAIGVCRPDESQTLDAANNLITATVHGFSRFGRMGAEFGYDLFLPIVVKNG